MPEQYYERDIAVLTATAAEKEEENDHFLRSLKNYDGDTLDGKVHRLNREVSAAIDCTACGNCCKTLIVNITHEEIEGLAGYLDMPVAAVREQYIEESAAGNCFINTVPCTFLAGTKCSIYEGRFRECRDFPHLHKTGFRERFLGTLLHYGSCPIIFNVVEELKKELGFYV